MGMRTWRMLVALLWATGLAALVPQLASADQPVTGPITGQVTNARTGGGVAGATVNLYLGSTLITSVQTDSGGNYNTGPRPFDSYELQFVDNAAGYGNVWYKSQPTQSQATPVAVNSGAGAIANQALQPDQVTGQLTDQLTGQAISGVDVELLNESGSKVADTTTDGNGDYSFSVLPGGTYEVQFNPGTANTNYSSAYYGGASATGFTVTPGQTTAGINGQLLSAGVLAGTVTNAAGQAIPSVGLQIVNVNTGYYYYTNTGSNGTYEIDGLPTGNYQLLFRPGSGEDYVYQYYPGKANAAASQPVSVTAGQVTSHIDATLATAATVSGKVTDAATGAPVSGAHVYVNEYGGGYPSYVYTNYATTDANGNWSIPGFATGTYQVQFAPPYPSNYASQYYNAVIGEDPPTPLTLTAGSTTSNIDAALSAGGQISGTVTDGTTGSAAPGVGVAAYDQAGEQFAYANTDSSGHYSLTGLAPSASYRVEFFPGPGSSLASQFYTSGATLQTATPVAVMVGQTTANIDETLGEGGSIAGVVTDAATGFPLGGDNVLLTDDSGNQVYANMDGVSTEPDGSYDFTNLPPGSYKVEFSSEGALGFQFYSHASTLSTATSVTVSAGQAVTNIDAALAQGGTVKGRVTDSRTGQGLADSEVEIVNAAGNLLRYGFTDPNGQYTVSGITPGSYYVEVMADSGGLGAVYQPEFYGGSGTLAGATPVTITAGQATSGIDLALSPGSANSQSVTATGQTTTPANMTSPPTVPTAQTTRVIPGPPTLSGGSVSGLGKGKPVVKFRLRSGSNGAHKLRSFKVKLPAGLAFVAAQLRKGVKMTGGGTVTEKLPGGQLVVTLSSPASAIAVSISTPALKVTRQLQAKAAQKRAGSLRVLVTATPVNGTGHMLSFTVKNPT